MHFPSSAIIPCLSLVRHPPPTPSPRPSRSHPQPHSTHSSLHLASFLPPQRNSSPLIFTHHTFTPHSLHFTLRITTYPHIYTFIHNTSSRCFSRLHSLPLPRWHSSPPWPKPTPGLTVSTGALMTPRIQVTYFSPFYLTALHLPLFFYFFSSGFSPLSSLAFLVLVPKKLITADS